MSEEEKKSSEKDAGQTATVEVPKKSNMMLFIIIGAVVVLGGGAAFFLLKGKGHEEPKPVPVAPTPETIVNHTFPDILINLKSDGGKPKFLKASLVFELGGPADEATIEQLTPRITDAFQVYLRELRPEEVDNAGGMDRLRDELLLRLNKITAPLKVHNILFKQFLVQ